ncbi:ATP-grasp domain-containing protein [Nocardiopsis mwathae]|uniref:ATP-grasp domain-containing protein n=1 Tax=Nocardiopsis mwathae TaxID=1472723 RepID=UPI00161F1EE6
MVTTAGSAQTSGTILHLRRQGFRIIATDIDPTAPGLYLADRGYVVPPGTSDAYLPEVRRICREERAIAIIPLVDEELVPVADLSFDDVAILLPRPDFVAVCLDKYVLMRRLAAVGIGVPATSLASEWDGSLEPPLVVKPRAGRGSRGVTVCTSPEEIGGLIADGPYAADDLIVQERICGPEYTVSVVVWRDGDIQAVVPKEVILKRGVTKYAVTRRNARVAEVCRAVQHELRADGPFNVQLALDADGEPRIFEINPRFSSTAPLTIASGVDEITGLLRQATRGGPRLADDWEEGLVMVRHWSDRFLQETEFTGHGISPAATDPLAHSAPQIAQVAR